jgi:hypothetical protein
MLLQAATAQPHMLIRSKFLDKLFEIISVTLCFGWNRRALLAIALMLCAGPAAGQVQFSDPTTVDRPRTLEDITGMPRQDRPAAVKRGDDTIVHNDRGGLLGVYDAYWRHVSANRPGQVEIRGMCQSACTLVMVHIPKERLCFGDRAFLNFHLASLPNGQPSIKDSQEMIDSYPADIRGWINAMGGIQKMPHEGVWTLHATLLWAMGYRRCGE